MQVRRAIKISVVIASAFVFPAAALAWHQPTRFERAQITAAARNVSHAGTQRVYVGQIHVSSVGPWASAGVTLYFNGQPDEAIDILHFRRGRWRNASIGSAGEWCIMPTVDQRNLGFSGDYPCE